VRKLGEVEYNRSRQALAVEWIRQHPREFVLLTIQRVERFWFPVAGSLPLSSWSTWTVTVLSMAGFAMLLLQRSSALWFLVPVITLFPLPCYLVNNDARLRYPILWLSALCAGYALTAVLAKFRSRTN